MTDWHEATVTARGARLHYWRSGGDKFVVVFAHGFSDNGRCWMPILGSLPQHYDVVLPDARGHGLSERLPADLTQVDLAEDLAAFLMALGLKGVVLGGHSMGAGSASVVAARHPELVRALVLEDPPWRPKDWSRKTVWNRLPKVPGQTLEQVMAGIREETPSWHEEEVRVVAEANRQLDFRILEGLPPSPHWTEVVPQIRCPGLVLTGDPKLGAIVTPAVAEEVQALWPQALFVRIIGAGHSIHREGAGAYLEAVTQFLTEQTA